MGQITFGAELHRLRINRNIGPSDLAKLMKWKHHQQVYKYENGDQLPRPETIHRLAEALRLGYADRLLLLGLAGHLVEHVLPTVDEEQQIITRFLAEVNAVSIPMVLVDYQLQVKGVNPPLSELLGRSQEEADQIILSGIDMFELIFDATLPLRDLIVNWHSVALDTLRDFVSFSTTRRHEPFYAEFPEKYAHLPDFVSVWNEAQIDPYFEMLKNKRSFAHTEVRMCSPVHPEKDDLHFRVTRHLIPLLGNHRFWRFHPHNAAAKDVCFFGDDD